GDISSFTTVVWGSGTSATREINYETKVDTFMHFDDAGLLLSTAVFSTLADGSISRVSSWEVDGHVEHHKYSILDDGALSQTIADGNDNIYKVTITSFDVDGTETRTVNDLYDFSTVVKTFVDDVRMSQTETFTVDDGTGNMKGDVVTYDFDPDAGVGEGSTLQIFTNADGTADVFAMDSNSDGTPIFASSIRIGSGTHSTNSAGTETLDVTLEANNDGAGRVTIETDSSGKETFTVFDTSNIVIEVEETYVDNDGALVTKITEGSVSTEDIRNEDGSYVIRTVDTATGVISETNVDVQGVTTVNSANATIDATANTATFDVTVNGNTVTTTLNLETGNDVVVVTDGGGAVLSTTTTTEDASGNEVILEVLAGGAKTETVINEKGDSQVTATTASGDVTVSEIDKLADGSSSTKVIGTGTVAEANGNSVLTLELVDGTSLTETTNTSTGAVSAETEDEFGNVRSEDASGNVTFADGGGAVIEATDFKSELDLDYDGAGSDAAFDAGEKFVFDFTAGTLMSDENYDPNHGNQANDHDNKDDDSATTVTSGTNIYNAGANAVRPENDFDYDIPMSYDIA
ncbi:MAG: hypothetical protein OSB34_12265, partial [Planktomarina sp.]|nr:hypothetical protein [Planktomarina sp.]